MGHALVRRYELVDEIARGAIGTVWRARDHATGEIVAVKVLHHEAASEPDVVAAFRQEAAVLAEIDHPGVVRPREFISSDGELALVMDLVEAVDLRQRLRSGGPLTPAAAIDVVAQVAGVLAAVHATGIVHGDVKPGNILVPDDPAAQVRLIDFGVARRAQDPAVATHATPEYVAPEVVDGNPLRPSSDVYSLGIVLYEALTARSPYRGGSVEDVLDRHRRYEVIQPAGLPEPLWDAITSCLELAPADRPDAAELAHRLTLTRPLLAAVPALPALPDSTPTYRPRRTIADALTIPTAAHSTLPTAQPSPAAPVAPVLTGRSPWARPGGTENSPVSPAAAGAVSPISPAAGHEGTNLVGLDDLMTPRPAAGAPEPPVAAAAFGVVGTGAGAPAGGRAWRMPSRRTTVLVGAAAAVAVVALGLGAWAGLSGGSPSGTTVVADQSGQPGRHDQHKKSGPKAPTTAPSASPKGAPSATPGPQSSQSEPNGDGPGSNGSGDNSTGDSSGNGSSNNGYGSDGNGSSTGTGTGSGTGSGSTGVGDPMPSIPGFPR
jgi:serine/threonine protein kinase